MDSNQTPTNKNTRRKPPESHKPKGRPMMDPGKKLEQYALYLPPDLITIVRAKGGQDYIRRLIAEDLARE